MFVVTEASTSLAVATVTRLERAPTRFVAAALSGSLGELLLKRLHNAISAGLVPVRRRALVQSESFVAPTTERSNFPPRSSTQ